MVSIPPKQTARSGTSEDGNSDNKDRQSNDQN